MFEVKFYLGLGKDRDGNTLSSEFVRTRLSRVRQRLAMEFGGYTEYSHAGGWVEDRATDYVVTEIGATFVVITDNAGIVRDTAAAIRDEFRQSAVLVTMSKVESTFV